MVWIGGWYSGCAFNFIRYCPKDCQGDLSSYTWSEILMSFVCPTASSIFGTLCLFIYSFISRICGCVWVSHCGFNPSFLREMRLNTFSRAAWLFANLSFWSVSSGLLPIFYYAVVIVVYGVLEYFYTLHVIHFLEIWLANIFSHLLAYLFTL